MSHSYYLLTMLPRPGEPGSAPPLRLSELLELSRGDGAEELVAVLVLGDDLVQRSAFLAHTLDSPQPAVLTPAQARGEAELPAYLQTSNNELDSDSGDVAWAKYLRHVASCARSRRCSFLEQWVGSEVALRNWIAHARARALGREHAADAAEDLSDGDAELQAAASAWVTARDPLRGEEILLRARWAWVQRTESWFGFGADELLAYTLRLLLLHRWHRLAQPAAGRLKVGVNTA